MSAVVSARVKIGSIESELALDLEGEIGQEASGTVGDGAKRVRNVTTAAA